MDGYRKNELNAAYTLQTISRRIEWLKHILPKIFLMSNIIDYLEWRGDIPFSVDPFNEVDNLVLSMLAYGDFKTVPEEGACIRDAAMTVDENSDMSKKAPLLLQYMKDGARFRNTVVCGYINEIDQNKQISAVTFKLEDGTAYVAYRGTDSSFIGWREDFDISFLTATEGQKRAAEYLSGIKGSRALRVGGHSKGGNFAVYAASFCDMQDSIIEVYSNDGPGFREEITGSEGYKRILSNIISIVPDTSLIGMLLSSKSERCVVKSTAFGLSQHDAYTWTVSRNRFIRTEMSDLGRAFERTMGSWLTQIDDETRRSFTDTIFTIFESTGQNSFKTLSDQKLKSAEAMISAIMNLPEDKRQEAFSLILKLGQTAVTSNKKPAQV